MKNLSSAQCHCARVLLKWDQAELARRCGLHVQTICLFETEQSTPTKRTLEKISTALENAGIEFTDGDGVRKSSRDIRKLQGTDGFRHLMDEVYKTARENGGDILILNGAPSKFLQWLGEEWYQKHAQRMRKHRDNFNFRVVAVKPGEEIAKDFATYKWIAQDQFYEHSVYIYGKYVAFITFEEDNVFIEITNRRRLAKTLTVLFEYVWNHVSPDKTD